MRLLIKGNHRAGGSPNQGAIAAADRDQIGSRPRTQSASIITSQLGRLDEPSRQIWVICALPRQSCRRNQVQMGKLGGQTDRPGFPKNNLQINRWTFRPTYLIP